MTVAHTLLKATFANVKVSMPYFTGSVEALCLKDPFYEQIIGRISQVRAPDNSDETWCVKVWFFLNGFYLHLLYEVKI